MNESICLQPTNKQAQWDKTILDNYIQPVYVNFIHGVPFFAVIFDRINLISAEITIFIQVLRTPDLAIPYKSIVQNSRNNNP